VKASVEGSRGDENKCCETPAAGNEKISYRIHPSPGNVAILDVYDTSASTNDSTIRYFRIQNFGYMFNYNGIANENVSFSQFETLFIKK